MRTYSVAGQRRVADYRRDRAVNVNTVPRDKLPAFVKLIDAAARRLGSTSAACRAMGIDDGVLHRWREGSIGMTTDTARRILAGWKKIKAGDA
jgi:hypothetical protein